MLRDHVADIITGSVFLFVGLGACGIAGMRRRSGVRALIWLGIWSAMYGARPLFASLADLRVLPHWLSVSVPYLNNVLMYLIPVVAARAFLEVIQGKLRLAVQGMIFVGLAIGLAGIAFFVFTGSPYKLLRYNNLLAACLLAVLVIVFSVPALSRKFFILPNRGVLAVGTLLFAIAALYVNLSQPLGYRVPPVINSLAFAVLLFSFAYAALQIVFASERRLLSIETELETARQIQRSILPSRSPELNNLRISTAYRPMTAVAGDFYEFIPVDQSRVGFLVADVSGHGVPAALIAAMIKVAMQSVAPCAHDPREVLRGLNRMLSGQLQDQFVTAAYLWLDTENGRALYSAAGHPPLLLWREDKLERIESNGLVLGVITEPDYPVCAIGINPGDRFLLYTDGVIEPEDANGDSFGDCRLEQVIRDNRSNSQSELLDQLLREISNWQPASATQQDDITLMVIDVV